MSDNAKALIDGLFERIKAAQKNTGERDREAEGIINKHLVENPCAPYYMAQTIIMQEAALKQLNAKVEALEQAAASKPSSGGFLSGLFGGSQDAPSGASQNGQAYQANGNNRSAWGSGHGAQQANYAQGQAAPSGFGRGGSFLGGALQTAAGVAGGMMVGNMLMNMFGHHSQTEMVDVINESPMDQGLGSNGMGQSDMGQSDMGQSDMGQGNSADTDFSNDGVNQGGFEQTSFDQGGMDSGGFDQGGFSDMGGGFDDFGGDDFF